MSKFCLDGYLKGLHCDTLLGSSSLFHCFPFLLQGCIIYIVVILSNQYRVCNN